MLLLAQMCIEMMTPVQIQAELAFLQVHMFHGQEVVKSTSYMWACVMTDVTLWMEMIGGCEAPSIVAWETEGMASRQGWLYSR